FPVQRSLLSRSLRYVLAATVSGARGSRVLLCDGLAGTRGNDVTGRRRDFHAFRVGRKGPSVTLWVLSSAGCAWRRTTTPRSPGRDVPRPRRDHECGSSGTSPGTAPRSASVRRSTAR